MNQEQINKDLAEKDNSSSEFQKKVVELASKYMKISAEQMSKFHDGWDNNDFVYRGYRLFDKDDKDAVKDGEPPKIVVPITFAQVQTAISFMFSTFSQRGVFYELSGRGPEDSKNCKAMEVDLDYQLTRQKWMFKLYCHLLDTMKYGFGVVKNQWVTEKCRMRVSKKVESYGMMGQMAKMFGQQAKPSVSYQEEVGEVTSYEGNKITNISPFSFYPDPSVTLANFQQGKFVGHDEETSRTAVIKEEGKIYFGTKKIPESVPQDELKQRKRRTGRLFGDNNAGDRSIVPGANEGNDRVDCVVLSEIMMELIPKRASEDFGMDLGNEDYPIKFLAVIGNDKKLIRFEPAGYLHNEFNYALGEYSPDHNTFYNPGLSDTIYELQNLITFFLNSHVVNVRKIIQNRFIGDETKVNIEDLKSGAMFIRMKQSGISIDKVIKQLETFDVTSRHVGDMDTLIKLVQVVTGINENALGQYSGGRRSATEARSVNAGAAARLKMHAQLFWLQALEPFGRQLLANTRQGRTKEVYNAILGERANVRPFEQVILADPNSLAGGYDFANYDATLPSDRQFQAGVFQELFSGLLAKPEAAAILGLSPIKLLDHIAELYNINNMHDFAADPANGLGQTPQVQVLPDEQVGNMLASSPNAQSVDMGGESLLRSLANG